MNWVLKRVSKGKVNLILPVFSSCEGEDATGANRLYRALEEEIISYASITPAVRRYSAESSISEEGNLLTVAVTLSARVFSSDGLTVRRRCITDVWCGDRLVSHAAT